MGNRSKFSLGNFKRWMKEHHDEVPTMTKPNPDGGIVGTQVESKISFDRLVSKMEVKGNNIEELALDFKENGGSVVDTDGKQFLVEVSTGCFKIHRVYVRRS